MNYVSWEWYHVEFTILILHLVAILGVVGHFLISFVKLIYFSSFCGNIFAFSLYILKNSVHKTRVLNFKVFRFKYLSYSIFFYLPNLNSTKEKK